MVYPFLFLYHIPLYEYTTVIYHFFCQYEFVVLFFFFNLTIMNKAAIGNMFGYLLGPLWLARKVRVWNLWAKVYYVKSER